MNYFKDLKDNCCLIEISEKIEEPIRRMLGDLVYELSEITYTEYKKEIRQTWNREKCYEKIHKDYPMLYCHFKKEFLDIDFIIGLSKFKKMPELNMFYSKLGFLCYSKEIKENKKMRNEIYSTLMSKIRNALDENHRVFVEVPLKSIKMKGFSIKYGKFKPCSDKKIVENLIKTFEICVKGEPEPIETELRDEVIKEVAYETYYKPHSILILTK